MSRSHGEGTVRQRSNGTWEGRYYEVVNGVRKRASVYATTEAELKKKLAQIYSRLEKELPAQNSNQKFGDWAKTWETTTLEAAEMKDSTKQGYASMLRTHILNSSLADLRLKDVKASNLEAFFSSLKKQGLSASTRRSIYATVSHILKGAVRDDLLDYNPLTKIDRPRAEHTEASFLEPDELRALIAALDPATRPADPERAWEHERDFLFIKFLALTGLRRGEALGLDWFNVNLNKGQIHIRWTLNRVNGVLTRTEPKTANSRRTLEASPAVLQLLREIRELQKRGRVEIFPSSDKADKLGANLANQNLVFTTRDGKPVDPRNALRAIQDAAKRAGVLKHVNVHTLRHSAASAMLLGGESIFVVSRHLGHHSIDITAKYYGHLTENGLRKASETLANVLNL